MSFYRNNETNNHNTQYHEQRMNHYNQHNNHYYDQHNNHQYNNHYHNEYNAYQQNNRYTQRYNNNNCTHNNYVQRREPPQCSQPFQPSLTSWHRYNNNNNENKSHKPFLNKQHEQHKQHYRPQSRVQPEIISVKTETLINGKKKAAQPIFYDTESELAKACQNIEYNLENSMFENEEKQRLIHNKRCSLIRDYNMNKNECIDSDNNPITPNASDTDAEAEDNNNDNNQIGFGATKKNQVRNIWERTNDFQMINEEGINILHNDNPNEYGIYTLNGIKQQAMIVPNDIMMDGNDLINNAQIKYKSAKINKKKKSVKRPQNGKNKKIRRGGNGKNKNRNNNNDEFSAQKLVNYLSMIRNQKV